MSEARAWTLPAAAWVATAETFLLVAVVLDRGQPGAPLFAAFLATKLPFCWRAAARRPGAYLALVLWEGVALLAAVIGDVPASLRLVEVALAGAALALLVASARLFPTVELR